MMFYIALLRGINVGKAKRIAMADLRKMVESLGYSEVSTLLNSGNVVFKTDLTNVNQIALAIKSALVSQLSVSVEVIVISAQTLAAVVQQNPLSHHNTDSSRLLVAFVSDPAKLALAKPLQTQSWQPDALAITEFAAYIWCAEGVLESQLNKAFSRTMKDITTTRNWATVLKLQALTMDARDAN